MISEEKITWSKEINAHVEHISILLSKLEIPFAFGKISGNGHTIIDVELCFLNSAIEKFSYGNNGSIGIIEIKKFTAHGETDYTKSVDFYVRNGFTNTWLHFGSNYKSLKNTENDFFFEEEIPMLEENTPSPDEIFESKSRLAYKIAKSEGFSRLTTKEQRSQAIDIAMFDLDLAPTDNIIHNSSEIAQLALEFYELGILPKIVAEMTAKKMGFAEIAKTIGISKNKVEKALNTVTPARILDFMD